ncbi:DUF6976 family protein [Azohydromonas lata]|uniref:DUF6976 family protein n=1 Tax=Azohydromonas lata TaxID=45677 RepID=UPI00082D8C87|nr:hypothetical protein [Azohydromonas lata]
MNQLISLEQASSLILGGAPLSVAGPEHLLDQLPAGSWVGGTIPYFMTHEGGVVVNNKVFVTDLSELGTVSLASYGADELAGIAAHAPDNGFSLTIIPAGGQAHQRFAAEAATYPDAFVKPTVGWISGVHLSELGKATPKVYDGRTGAKYEDRAVVAYVSVPDDKLVMLETVNLFEPDGKDVIHFSQTGFHVDECEVNGEVVNFAEYVKSRGFEGGQCPLVGDFAGAHVNVSLQGMPATGGVDFYAPVFPGVDYHFAKAVPDYVGAFRERLEAVEHEGVVWSCNCILNFVFGGFEGKAIGGEPGAVTFGEIAYQLLNQTMVMVRIA